MWAGGEPCSMSRPDPHATLYDHIGTHYDATRRADPYLVGRLIHHLKAEPNGEFLDMACGTGNYTVAVALSGIRVHGIDQSRRMIAAARDKSRAVSWYIGNVEALPFRDGLFSGVMCTLAIHHFQALRPVFQEVFRVLARGRLVLFTSTAEQMRGYWLNAYFPIAMARSMAQMPSLPEVVHALRESGFTTIHTELYEVQPALQDFFLYSGKHRPEMYLDPHVRAGISTFAALTDASEVAEGCRKLFQDIQSGRIADVIAIYQHGRGDYLFVVGEKGRR
jgi:ubiquinone/menaquinone biosynthesis C-methylase UbiE